MGGRLHIGTSGFSYDHWKGIFYPEGLKSREWLEFYCRSFDTVELNSSFYHLPSEKVVESWRQRTPRDFLYAVKASRYITHRLKLSGVDDSLRLFYGRMEHLGPKLGPILFQLPPSLKIDLDKLADFCGLLKDKHRHVIEFRHESWDTDETLSILREHNVCACFVSMPGIESIEEVTSDFIYIRFHGAEELYASKYTKKQLQIWRDLISEYRRSNLDIYAYFNNDYNAFAVENAMSLKDLLSGR
jgi:uncharacterized protein YecE (DUF72 family)